MPEPVPAAAPTPQRTVRDGVLYRRLLAEARPSWAHLAGLFLVQVLATPIALLAPVPLQIAVDQVLGQVPLPSWLAPWIPAGWRGPEALLAVAAGIVVVSALLAQLQDMYAWVYRTWLGERLVLALRGRLFLHLQRLSLAHHDAGTSAESVYRVQTDALAIETVVVQGLLRIVTVAFRVVVLVVVAAQIDAKLVLVALLAGPVMVLLARRYRGRLRARWKEAKAQEAAAMGVVQETLSAVRVVKAFAREEHERDRWRARADAGVAATMRATAYRGWFDVLMGATAGLAGAAVLYVGVEEARAGAVTLGQLLLVVGYLSQLFGPMRELGNKMADLQRALAGAERVFAVLDTAPEVVDAAGATALRRATGEVEFRGVTFGYGDGPPVLDDVSFRVPAGARVGIAGRTGAGKSTLLALLFRFYDPQRGTILLDGVDTRTIRVHDLRRQLALVLQDTVLFSTSVAENIAYGRPGATTAEIEAAARAADAHEFVSRLPRGYETPVGERGVRLSGGERQRIALARAFLKDAPVLVLDEPTSALDLTTETSVMAAIERLMRGRTTFLVAHRPSTLAGCDVRLRLEHGRFVAVADAASGDPTPAPGAGDAGPAGA